MTLKNNRVPLLSNIKLFVSFHRHMWIQTGVTVPKRISGVMTSVTLTFDLWPWPLAWTFINCNNFWNFMMIRWQEHSKKGVTDGQTDGQTERSVLRAAWSQLKIPLRSKIYVQNVLRISQKVEAEHYIFIKIQKLVFNGRKHCIMDPDPPCA